MASPFWQYFHDRLNWPAIFRPGPVSALVKGLALYMDDVREDILWLRRQWNPSTADDDMIAAYGTSRGILRTRYDSDESYRLRVSQAFVWHKLGGKVQGARKIFSEFGFPDMIVSNVSDPALWAHFDVTMPLTDAGLSDAELALFWSVLYEVKPARSVPRRLTTTASIRLPIQPCVALMTHTVSQANLRFAPIAPPVLPLRTFGVVVNVVTQH